MYLTTLSVPTLLAITTIANPTPDLEKRYRQTRLTQYADNVCKTPQTFEAKGWNVDCVNIDGSTNGFNLDLGSGPEGHGLVQAYSQSGCADDAVLGILLPINGVEPGKGACVDANDYLVDEPNHFGYRINSVKFLH